MTYRTPDGKTVTIRLPSSGGHGEGDGQEPTVIHIKARYIAVDIDNATGKPVTFTMMTINPDSTAVLSTTETLYETNTGQRVEAARGLR